MKRFSSLPWMLALTAVSSVAVFLAMRLHSVSDTLARTYRYDCTIRAVDAVTYQPLRIMGANGPAIDSKDLFNQSYVTAFTPEGALKISGIAYEPRKLGIAVDGYRAVAITINSETPPQLEIPMKRVSEVEKK